MTTKRLQKKFHKYWLQDVLIDASQSSHWRRILFDADYNVPFTIDKDHMEGMNDRTARAIKRHELRFLVAKVPPEIAEGWLSEGVFHVIFKFWCADYPTLCAYSGNNPEVI